MKKSKISNLNCIVLLLSCGVATSSRGIDSISSRVESLVIESAKQYVPECVSNHPNVTLMAIRSGAAPTFVNRGILDNIDFPGSSEDAPTLLERFGQTAAACLPASVVAKFVAVKNTVTQNPYVDNQYSHAMLNTLGTAIEMYFAAKIVGKTNVTFGAEFGRASVENVLVDGSAYLMSKKLTDGQRNVFKAVVGEGLVRIPRVNNLIGRD